MKKFALILFLSISILADEEYLAIGLICESKEKDYQYFVINKINDEYSSMCIDLLGNPRLHSKPFECIDRGDNEFKDFFMTPDSFISRYYIIDRKTLKAQVGRIYYDKDDGEIGRFSINSGEGRYTIIYQCNIAKDPTNVFNYVVNAKKLELEALFSTNKL
jgi:hypothetical protein